MVLLDIKNIDIVEKSSFAIIPTDIEHLQCNICHINTKNVAFNCGHLVCGCCVQKVGKNCPHCRKEIHSRTEIFL